MTWATGPSGTKRETHFSPGEGVEVVRIAAAEALRSPEEVAEMLVRYCSSK
jgi:hypothetical protein